MNKYILVSSAFPCLTEMFLCSCLRQVTDSTVVYPEQDCCPLAYTQGFFFQKALRPFSAFSDLVEISGKDNRGLLKLPHR